MITMKKRSLAIVIAIAIVIGTITTGMGVMFVFGIGNYTAIRTADFVMLQQSFLRHGKLDYLMQLIEDKYYREVDWQALQTSIYRGLFYGLNDMYSSYMTAEEYEALLVSLSGEFQGIGITFSYNEQHNLVIISTMDNSPARDAGLLSGDIIWMVDGVRYTAAEMNAAGAHMRGQAGTNVTLTILRGAETKEFEITRGTIVKQSVQTTMLEDDIAYIRISTFEDTTGEDFQRELRGLEMQGVRGMIIDLRNNGGGILSSGTQIADLLLSEGTIVYLMDNTGRKTPTNSDRNATQIPYVLLVNGSTASTSEILAAAVQDNNGGKLVGTRTFGKGTVQSLIPLAGGSGAVRLTTSQYLSPNGNAIHQIGITPDYIVELIPGDARDLQLEKAIELLKSNEAR